MSDTVSKIQTQLSAHTALLAQIEKDANLCAALAQSIDAICTAYRNGGKVLICGNGGSAADAQHVAAEFVGRFKLERRALPAIALTTDTSILTALANDYGYDTVFARLVEAHCAKGDVFIAISTSGNAANTAAAADKAKELGATVIALTGQTGGQLKTRSDILLNIPTTDTPRIQEAHITLLHILCDLVEKELFA